MTRPTPNDAAPQAERPMAAEQILAIARELAAELHPRSGGMRELGPDNSLEVDFGLDSLARLELALRLERELHVSLPDEAIAEASTPADLARAAISPALPGFEARGLPARDAAAGERLPASTATLVEALAWRGVRQAGRTHVLLIERNGEPLAVTFGALHRQALAIAAGLKRCGVSKGHKVGIMLPTSAEMLAAFYGSIYAQAVPVPLYPPARISQLEAHLRRISGILANAEAAILVTDERVKPLARLLAARDAEAPRIETAGALQRHGAESDPGAAADSDVAFLQYTSGSTGNPKGVVLTHRNIVANLRAMQQVTGAGPADCFVSWLPLYHDMGLIGACLGALLYDFALVLMSPLAFLSHPARWLWAIHRHRATLTAAPNFAYELCLNKIRDEELSGLDLSSLRLAFNGAEPVSADTVERFCERFGRYGFRRSAMTPVYGLAECALGLTFTSPGAGPHIELVDRDALRRRGVAAAAALDAPSPLRMVSCGSPLPGHLLRIADERASPLPERRQGRIQFRGPSATSGYYRNAEDTARLKHGEWLDTGDLGYLADGELYVTGRAKDIIIRGGQNLHPQELEEAVGRLEGVRKGGVAVFAAADPARGTERVVVVAETTETEAERCARLERAIRALAVDLLGTPPDEVVLARPRTVLKTSSGKIRRAACREAFERGELGAEARVSWRSLVRLGAARGRARSVRTVRRLLARAWGIYALVAFWSIATIAWLAIVSAPGLMRRRKLARAFARIALASCALAPRVIRASPSPLPPRCIVIANHASYLDGVLLTAVLPPRFAFVAKREFAPQRLLGTFLRRLGAVFVERDEWALAAASGRRLQDPLGRGQSLIVFPEGTFRRDPGLLPFRSGAFIAAAATATPLIPTTIRGARAALADGMRLPRRVPLEIVFDDSQMPGGADWHAAIAAQQRVRETLLGRLGEPDADTPGERSGASLAHVS